MQNDNTAFSGLFQDKGLFNTDRPASVITYKGPIYKNLRAAVGRPGLIRGEMAVVGVASGGGKTVICNQLMVDAALQGLHVLYVSSEMDDAQMRARFASYASWRITLRWLADNGCTVVGTDGIPDLDASLVDECPYEPVPYDLLKVEGINPDNWTAEAIADDPARTPRMLDTLLHVYDNYIMPYFHYVRIQDVSGRWDKCMACLERNTGVTPALVCVDWLGGCIGDPLDKTDIRRSLLQTANTIADLAREHNFAAVVTTQLGSDSDGLKYPPISTFGECKSVKDRACVAMAVSSLGESDLVNNKKKVEATVFDGTSGKLALQGMNCGKSRFGNSGCFDVRRMFDYQCYVRF